MLFSSVSSSLLLVTVYVCICIPTRVLLAFKYTVYSGQDLSVSKSLKSKATYSLFIISLVKLGLHAELSTPPRNGKSEQDQPYLKLHIQWIVYPILVRQSQCPHTIDTYYYYLISAPAQY